MASVHGQHEIGLFGFGWQTRRWPAALNIHNDHRQLKADRQAERLGFEVQPRARGACHRQTSGESRTERDRCRSDFILGCMVLQL
jgi:hypothetical protein